jgi:hypothetical protein
MGELNGRTLRDITTQPLAQTDSVVPGPVPNLTRNHADATTEPSVKRWRSPKVSPMRAQPEDGDWIGGPQSLLWSTTRLSFTFSRSARSVVVN